MGRNYKEFSGKSNPNYKTGYAVKGKRPSFYNTWQNMKARCNRPKHPKYNRYGGRGIKICKEWESIEAFAKWALKNGWEEGLSIDRIDNDGDYTPQNCRWVSISKNSRKKSTTKITFEQAKHIRKRAQKGECGYELAKEYNVTHGTVWFIVNNFTHVPEMECIKKLKERNTKNDLETVL